MATSSIFADFSIRDNRKADAFADACEKALHQRRAVRKPKARLVTSEKELDDLFDALNKKYGCSSR
jgi:hypothetical protein